MKKNSILFILLFSLQTFAAEYVLEWDHPGLSVDTKIALAPRTMRKRVAEHGVMTDKLDIPIEKLLPEGKVTVHKRNEAILYLFVKNNSKKPIRFSVAPHSTNPGHTSLGFDFNCLCNGHVYELPPEKVWYRVMSLRNRKNELKETVKLKHVLFKVNK